MSRKPVFPEEILFLLVLHFVRKPQKKEFLPEKRKGCFSLFLVRFFWSPFEENGLSLYGKFEEY